ncbi:acyl-CoA thioesterase [Erythrobacter sp. WG]|uniref:acyl-CoA thioesterase n=1 Tax=Erythrobacter sp. WG TaxID=2985510 RepID=UPI0022713AD7|nr:thioesterase family protein [Erythrobacter sp. WG]MCX9148746.1 acyl-CoA thioesterase [Erythrobacter sp. WG]
MAFVHTTKVRFAHVDAAGIVFYPRFFEMLNAAVEDWFAMLGRDFRALHLEDRIGTPTVRLETEFLAPAMLGDELAITLVPAKIGTSSCTYRFVFAGAGTERLKGEGVLVCMDLEAQRSRPWPEAIAASLRAALP